MKKAYKKKKPLNAILKKKKRKKKKKKEYLKSPMIIGLFVFEPIFFVSQLSVT